MVPYQEDNLGSNQIQCLKAFSGKESIQEQNTLTPTEAAHRLSCTVFLRYLTKLIDNKITLRCWIFQLEDVTQKDRDPNGSDPLTAASCAEMWIHYWCGKGQGVQQQLIHAMKDRFSTKQLQKASYKAATSDLVEMYGIHLTIEPILDLLEGKCSWIAMTNTAQMTKNRWTE